MAFIELWCSNCNELHDPDGFHVNEKLSPGVYLWVKRQEKKKNKKKNKEKSAFPWKLVSILSKRDNILTVKMDNQMRVLDMSSKLECLPFESEIVDDLTELQHAHKPGILHNLKKRAVGKEPYTFIGNVLISINPLRFLPEPEILTSDNERDWSIPLPPHPRSVAEKAFRQMLFTATQRLRLVDIDNSNIRQTVMAPTAENLVDRDSDFAKKYGLINQSVIISGESGSGKTEASKRVIQQLLERELLGLALGSDADDEDEQEFQDRLLGSTILLESLGNATTKRNPNSSRFGSFLRLNYQPVYHDDSPTPGFYTYGASFTTYLLERSRVTYQAAGERNYNIFYQLLTSPNQNLQAFLGFKQAKKQFRYLGFRFEKTDEDRKGYSKLRTALRMADLNVRNPYLFEVLGAILHLGNVDFVEETKAGQVRARILGSYENVTMTKNQKVKLKEKNGKGRKNRKTNKFQEVTHIAPQELAKKKTKFRLKDNVKAQNVRPLSGKLNKSTVFSSTSQDSESLPMGRKSKLDTDKPYSPFRQTCTMLGLKQKDVAQMLLRKVVKAGKEKVVKFSSVEQAQKRRDAFAKHLYASLFDWVIYTINRGFNGQPDTENVEDTSFIGILDIFGFEQFKRNSLEQLLVNYANEVLLSLFVREIIIDESTLYKREGLILKENELEAIAQESESYTECISLFEGLKVGKKKTAGLISVINGQRYIPQPSDKKLLKELHKTFKNNSRYPSISPTKVDQCFLIRHYASTVEYQIKGFLKKNDQSLPSELIGLFKGSKQRVVSQFPRVYSKKLKAETMAAMKNSNLTKRQILSKKNVGASTTVCSVFETQLRDLQEVLSKTNCHYIRCVKPNPTLFIDHKKAFLDDMVEASGFIEPLDIITRKFNALKEQKTNRNNMLGHRKKIAAHKYFETDFVDEQLSNLGVYDCVNVLKCGLPTRIPYSAFTSIFSHTFPLHEVPFYRNRSIDFRERMFVGTLLKIFSQGSAVYKLGNTKVFFPSGELEQFQDILSKTTSNLTAKAKRRLKRHFYSHYAQRLWKTAFAKIKALKYFTLLLNRIQAAKMIQRMVRNYLKDKFLRKEAIRRRAAIKCQRTFRCYSARRALERLRADNVRQIVPVIDDTTSEEKETDFDEASYQDVEIASNFEDDAFAPTLKNYFNRKTEYNRNTNVLSKTIGGEAMKRYTTYKQTISQTKEISNPEDDEEWNNIEFSLLELDGERADPEMNPFIVTQRARGDSDEEEILGLDDIEENKTDTVRVKVIEEAPVRHVEPERKVRVTINKLNPKYNKRSVRKTVSFPEWRNIRLKPVQRNVRRRQRSNEGRRTEEDVRKRAKNIWGATLRRVKD